MYKRQLQLRANSFVAGSVLERLEQRLGLVLVLFELIFDGLHGRQIVPGIFTCLGRRCPMQSPQEDIEIAFAMLQCIDEEPERRELLRHGFEVTCQRSICLLYTSRCV